MKTYLVQHGKAVDKQVEPDRPLAAEGLREVQQVGALLGAREIAIPEVWHSGKTRARQTAECLAGFVARDGHVESRRGLDPKDDVIGVAHTLNKRDEDVMIVGHLPFLSKLAALLVMGNADREVIAFTYAGVNCLERDENGQWRVVWIIVPDLCGA